MCAVVASAFHSKHERAGVAYAFGVRHSWVVSHIFDSPWGTLHSGAMQGAAPALIPTIKSRDPFGTSPAKTLSCCWRIYGSCSNADVSILRALGETPDVEKLPSELTNVDGPLEAWHSVSVAGLHKGVGDLSENHVRTIRQCLASFVDGYNCSEK